MTFQVDGDEVKINTQLVAIYADLSGSLGVYQLTLTGGNAQPGIKKGEAITFIIQQSTPISTGTFNFTGPSVGDNVITAYVKATSNQDAGVYSSINGSFTITEFDLAGEKISGSFNGMYTKDLESPLGADKFPDNISITNGQFNKVILTQ
jgi:hypothetical protein